VLGVLELSDTSNAPLARVRKDFKGEKPLMSISCLDSGEEREDG